MAEADGGPEAGRVRRGEAPLREGGEEGSGGDGQVTILLLMKLTSLKFYKQRLRNETSTLYFNRHRDMQRDSRAEIHYQMALMRRAVRTWICAVKMRGGSEDLDEEGISSSESLGRNAGINEHTEQG